MFIQYGSRRINIEAIKEYKSFEEGGGDAIESKDHQIKLIYTDGKPEVFHFFRDKEGRDEFLKKIDRYVRIQSNGYKRLRWRYFKSRH
jgi:hypothetical protein